MGNSNRKSDGQPAEHSDNARANPEPAAEWVELDRLKPWDKNPRRNDAAVPKVVESIRRFGFGNPILARKADGEIIAGHTRLRAARELGLTQVPVRYMALDPSDAHLLALADNKLAEVAEWDEDEVASVLSDFSLDDAALAGWSADEVDQLSAAMTGDDVVQDDVPEPPEQPITKPGDLIRLGAHRVLCADSTERKSFARLLGDEKANMVFTDPPYGVSYIGKTDDALPVHNDGAEELPGLLAAALGEAKLHCMPGAVWYVCGPPGPNMSVFLEVLMSLGVLRQLLIWAKDVFVLGHSDYHYQHESIFYGWVEGPHKSPPDRKQTSLWEFERPKASRQHPTMKPLELVAKALRNSSRKNELILDAFLGSGTTLIAAEQLGRRCCGLEVSPQYCDVIVRRWEELTGKTSTRESL